MFLEPKKWKRVRLNFQDIHDITLQTLRETSEGKLNG